MTSPWFMSCWNAVKHLLPKLSCLIFLPSVARFACATSPRCVSGGALPVVFEIFPPYSRRDDRLGYFRCFALLQHDSAMIVPCGFVISSERSDERSLLLAVVEMTIPWFMSCWNVVKHLVLSASYEIFLPSVARFARATSPHCVSGGACLFLKWIQNLQHPH